MASILSNYLSRPKTVKTAGATSFPVIKRANPYMTGNKSTGPTSSAPFAGQDLAAALMQQTQNRQISTPSNNFQDTYNYDPIQTKIRALGTQSVADANTNAAQLRKEAAINQGDPDLLRALGFDQNTVDAASGNPQSLTAQLNLDYQTRTKQLAESMQNQNLFYSGEYQNNLLNMAKGKATAQGNLGQSLRDLLSGADTGVLNASELARTTALQEQLAAQQAAKDQAAFSDLIAQLGMVGAPLDSGVPSNTGGLAPAAVPPPYDETTDPNSLWWRTHYGAGRLGGI